MADSHGWSSVRSKKGEPYYICQNPTPRRLPRWHGFSWSLTDRFPRVKLKVLVLQSLSFPLPNPKVKRIAPGERRPSTWSYHSLAARIRVIVRGTTLWEVVHYLQLCRWIRLSVKWKIAEAIPKWCVRDLKAQRCIKVYRLKPWFLERQIHARMDIWINTKHYPICYL